MGLQRMEAGFLSRGCRSNAFSRELRVPTTGRRGERDLLPRADGEDRRQMARIHVGRFQVRRQGSLSSDAQKADDLELRTKEVSERLLKIVETPRRSPGTGFAAAPPTPRTQRRGSCRGSRDAPAATHVRIRIPQRVLDGRGGREARGGRGGRPGPVASPADELAQLVEFLL